MHAGTGILGNMGCLVHRNTPTRESTTDGHEPLIAPITGLKDYHSRMDKVVRRCIIGNAFEAHHWTPFLSGDHYV